MGSVTEPLPYGRELNPRLGLSTPAENTIVNLSCLCGGPAGVDVVQWLGGTEAIVRCKAEGCDQQWKRIVTHAG